MMGERQLWDAHPTFKRPANLDRFVGGFVLDLEPLASVRQLAMGEIPASIAAALTLLNSPAFMRSSTSGRSRAIRAVR
jgi:hypothetical protein